MPRPRIILLVLLGSLLGCVAAASGQTETVRAAGTKRLASHLAQTAVLLLESQRDDPDNILTAHVLAREASALAPDDVDLLRFRLSMEALVEDEAGYAETLIRLSEADPDDEVVRLKRLRLALERFQTAEDRIAALERLLRRDDLSPTIASRLAFDLALLHRRRGDLTAFGDALSQSVALDPANRAAVAIATGFFHMNVDDAEAEIELLVATLFADPVDVITQSTLARSLLERGAYTGAARMHRLAISTIEQLRSWPPDELVADLALAHLGAGRTDLAIRVIDDRQRRMNERYHMALRQDKPELNALERAQYEATLHPTLGTVRAVALTLEGDPGAADAARAAIDAYESMIAESARRETPATDEQIAAWRLNQALVAVVLAHDVAQTRLFLDEVERTVPLTDTARHRFDGWIALRGGDYGEAVRLLGPLAATDAVAAIGLGEAELQRGNRREAARHLLAAATAEPGTVIGVCAGRRLIELLGRQVPISAEARRLEKLLESVPRTFDMLPESPSLAVGLDVSARKPVFQPFEPIVIDITISNHSQYPLAIDRDGPIRPQVLLQFETTFNRADLFASTPPIVIDIDRRLRLEPRERLVVPVDIRRFHLGQALNEAVLVGAFVRVRAMTNFVVRPNGVVEPGLLGVQHESTTLRIEGERVTPEWAMSMVRELDEVDSVDDLTRIALLGHLPSVLDQRLARFEQARRDLRIRTDVGSRKELELLDAQIEEHLRLAAISSDTLLSAFTQLDDVSKAWVLAVLPIRALPEGLRQLTQRSENRLVQMTHILFKLSSADDPMLDAGVRSADPAIRQVAETYVKKFRRMDERGDLPDLP